MIQYPNPLIEQRADPFIHRHSDGYYYFTASVPEYDRIELRRAKTINGLAAATPVDIWHKHPTGPMSALIWAPEIHYIDDKWYIYFAAAHSPEIVDGLFQHRMFVLECDDENPLSGRWQEKGQVKTHLDTFCLDATSFEHRGKRYYLWAQRDPAIPGNSNLYLSEMATPWQLKGRTAMLTKPELPWEIIGFKVNEGPAVIKHDGRIFISFSASATDENYCIGIIHADENSDLLNPSSWRKEPQPLFTTNRENKQFGPGHNCFTLAEDGKTDILVYHARNYTEIEGDPLYDPNRHTRVQAFSWSDDNLPVFGTPRADD